MCASKVDRSENAAQTKANDARFERPVREEVGTVWVSLLLLQIPGEGTNSERVSRTRSAGQAGKDVRFRQLSGRTVCRASQQCGAGRRSHTGDKVDRAALLWMLRVSLRVCLGSWILGAGKAAQARERTRFKRPEDPPLQPCSHRRRGVWARPSSPSYGAWPARASQPGTQLAYLLQSVMRGVPQSALLHCTLQQSADRLGFIASGACPALPLPPADHRAHPRPAPMVLPHGPEYHVTSEDRRSIEGAFLSVPRVPI